MVKSLVVKNEVTQAKIAERIGKIAAELILSEARSQRFGVILRDLEPIDSRSFILTALKGRKSEKLSLRLALPDSDLATTVLKVRAKLAEKEAELITDSEEVAVQWRNEHLRTIAVLANKPLTRGASLREFEIRDDRDVIKYLVEQKSEEASTAFLKNFWKALIHSQAPNDFRLQDIVKLTLELEALADDEARGLQIKDFLPIVGLFKDSKIADKNTPSDIAKRIFDNRQLIESAQFADKAELKRMQGYINNLSGEEKQTARKIQRQLRKLAELGGEPLQAVLSNLEFAQSQKVWLGRKTISAQTKNKVKTDFQPIHLLSLKAILEGDNNLIDDLYESVEQGIQRLENGEEDSKSVIDLTQDAYGSRPTLKINQNIMQLIQGGTSEEIWGITVELEELSEATILKVDEWGKRTSLKFNEENGPGGLIRTFVENDALSPVCLPLSEQLQQHREVLIKCLPGLASAPLTTLAAKPEVRQAAALYLKVYGELLEAVTSSAQEARSASSLAEKLFASLIVLETYIFKNEEEFSAVLSPLHPLHLWRWIVAVEELFERREQFNPSEIAAIEETLISNLHYLTALHLPRETTQTNAIDLGLAGQIGPLPLYRKQPRSLGTEDGVNSLGKLVNALAKMRPFVRPGLRVLLVNPPRPATFVKELVKQVKPDIDPSSDVIAGLHIRIRYTASDAISWVDNLDELDEESKEIIAIGQAIGRISLDVSNQKLSQQALEDEVRQVPAHLTVIFDPFEVRGGVFRREGTFSLNPWVLSYRYEYDRIQKKVNQIPVADSSFFGSYLQLVGTVEPRWRNHTIAHAANAEDSKLHLAAMSNHSTWLVVADWHGVSIEDLGKAYCVDIRRDKMRTLTTLARHLEPFEQALERELRKTFFAAPKDTLASIVADLIALEPEGILGIGSAQKEGDHATKAALGKIVVVRSYRRDHPSGLAVSLDTPEARQWLVAGRESRKQADLIGLREAEDGSLILDILEVKTHDAGTLFTVENGIITGDPVNQVMATYRAVASIFGGTEADSPLVRPRREVLRNHLYQACLRDTDPKFKQRWHSLLNDLFDRKVPLKIQAQIVRVQLASVAPSERAVLVTQEGIPIVFRTLNAEEVGLTLRGIEGKSTPKQGELNLQPITQVSQPVSPELEPTFAFSRLQSQPSQPEAIGPTSDKIPTDESNISDGVPALLAETSLVEELESSEAPTSQPEPIKLASSDSLSVLLGVARRDNTPRYWEVAKQPNGFFLILGASGSGKTETLKVIATQIHNFEIPCLIFDFHGDVVLEGAEDYILSHGPASTYGINPMELDSTDPADGGVYAQVNILLSMLKACIPSLGHRQWRLIKDTLNEAYDQAGITDTEPATWVRTPPTFENVLNLLENQLDDDSIPRSQRSIIESAYDAVARVFEHPIFSKERQILIDELLSRSHRLNLVHLEEEIRFVVTETLLRKLARAMKSRGSIPVQPQDDFERFRLFVIIDEAKILSMGGKDRDAASAVLNTLATEYRKFGLGMVLASQMSDHFSNETKAQMATRLVLKPFDFAEAKKNAQDVNLTADDLMQLTGRGDGYLRIGTKSSPTRIQITPLAERNK